MEEKLKVLITYNDADSLCEELNNLTSPVAEEVILACLSFAIQKNKQELFNLICSGIISQKFQVDINKSLGNGLNALALTVMQNNKDFFQKLLLLGANPCAPIERNISKMNVDLRERSASCDTIKMSPFSMMVDLYRTDMVLLAKTMVLDNELLEQAIRVLDKKEAKEIVDALLREKEDFVRQEFLNAIQKKDASLCGAIIKTGKITSLDYVGKEGVTPLILAVQNDAIDVVDVIKDALDAKKLTLTVDMSANGTNALNEACLKNNPALVKKLLFMGASFTSDLGVARKNSENKQIIATPLLTFVEKVLAKKEDLSRMQTLVSSAIGEVLLATHAVKIAKFLKTDKVYNILLKNKKNLADLDQFGLSMVEAVRAGDVDFVSFLMDRHVSILTTYEGKTPILEAIKEGQKEVLSLFINETSVKKLETKINGVTPFETAVWYGKEGEALMLLKSGVQPSWHFKTGESILMRAVDLNMGLLINELLLSYPEVKTSKTVKQAFWQAIGLKRNRAIKGFCASKLDLFFKTSYGMGLFHLAVKHKNYQAMLDLYQAGADIDEVNLEGQTPLHLAVLNKDIKATQMLLLMGVRKKEKDKNGQTPVMIAKSMGLASICQLFLKFTRADLKVRRLRRLKSKQNEKE